MLTNKLFFTFVQPPVSIIKPAIAINHENEQFLLNYSKPKLIRVMWEIGGMAYKVLKVIRKTPKCANPDTMEYYKERLQFVQSNDFHNAYQRCVIKYEHYGMDAQINYTEHQQLLFGHVIDACAESAKRIIRQRILDVIWECVDMKRIMKYPWHRDKNLSQV